MAVTSPICNVTILRQPGNPFSPSGFRTLSSTATLQDVISAFNDNFSAQAQQDEFNRQLDHDINGTGTGTQSRMKPSQRQVPKSGKKEVGKLQFRQASIVRQKIKVENPKDKQQWVIDDRVKALTMKDAKTGAVWIWQDKQAGKGVRAGTEERTQGEGH